MTERYNSFVVVLEEDIREDEADKIINALSMISKVIAVEPHVSNSIDEIVAEQRVRSDLTTKLWQVLYPKLKSGK